MKPEAKSAAASPVNWNSQLGAMLAVAGSAVGFGNFLRFPGKTQKVAESHRTARHGKHRPQLRIPVDGGGGCRLCFGFHEAVRFLTSA